jgi:hypothetical protein
MQKDLSVAGCTILAIAALFAPPAAATGGGPDEKHGGKHGERHGQGHAGSPKRHDEPAPAAAPDAGAERREAKADKRAAKARRKAEKRAAKAQRKAARKHRRRGATTPVAEPAPVAAEKPSRAAKPKKAKKRGSARKRHHASRGGGDGQPRITICHATGSATNPYVVITPASPGVVRAHERHQADGDIVPAPAGGCPTTIAATSPPVTGDDDAKPAAAPAAASDPAAPAPSGASAPAPVAARADSTALPAAADGDETVGIGSSTIISGMPETPEVGVLGEAATIDDRNNDRGDVLAATADTGPRATTELDDGELPFTGWQVGLLALLGAAALLGGLATRRASRQA